MPFVAKSSPPVFRNSQLATLLLLITGICGFVGSTIAMAWRNAYPGDTLIGIDNLSRSGAWVNREKLQKAGVKVVHGDIRCASDLDLIGKVDWVIDAAANPSVLAGVDGKASSRQLVEHNLIGTINLLEFCKQHQAGFTLLSTSRVYSILPLANLSIEVQNNAYKPSASTEVAGLSQHGINESFATSAPVSLYGSTKLASEQLALEYGDAFNFPVWINRCGVLAGAGQFGKADQGIFAYWLHSYQQRKPLKYIGFDGKGHQVRDCLHPRDLVPILQKQITHTSTPARNPSPQPSTKHQEPSTAKRHQAPSTTNEKPRIINVSGGVESARSLAQLSDWCAQRWPKVEVINSPEHRPYDLPWVVLDNRKATEHWEWRPETTTDQILNEIATFAEQTPHWLEVSTT